MGLFRFLKNNWLLILTIILGWFLLTYRLGSIPSGVYVDEAVANYDAYSILNTFKDHFGKNLPVYFKFFGSYTPGLYVYIQTIFIKIFGLNSYSIRLLSVISMLSVAVVIYWFLKKNKLLRLEKMAWLAVLMFLVTPWTVFNARLGYETTFAFALLAIGAMLYKYPLYCFGLISLSAYAGYTERYLAPLLMVLIYFVFYFKQKSIKTLKWPIILAALIQIPNVLMLASPAFWVKNSSLTGSFFSQYLSYFSPYNLFFSRDYDLQRSVPELAVFYWWMFVPWILGLYTIYINRKKPIYKYLIGLLLLAPLPAALANTNYSTQRALPLLLPYILAISIGSDRIMSRLNAWFKGIILILVIGFSLTMLWRSYFVLFPVERARAWNYGYEQLADFIKNNPEKHYVVDNYRGIPYILLLFHLSYSPLEFQRENPQNISNYYIDATFIKNAKFGNVEVRQVDLGKDTCKDQVLVGDNLWLSPDQVKAHNLEQVFKVEDGQQQIILQAYETNPKVDCSL